MVSKNIFATEAEIQSLPTTGAEWARVQTISGADPGTGNLDLINSTHGPSLIVMALRWRRDGGGLGKQRVIDEAFQALATYTAATAQPLNPFRQIGAYVRALDLVDCPMTTVVPDVGITYGALLDRLVTFDFPGNTRWSNMRECTKDSGSNWGSMARDAFTAIALVRGNATWIDECLRSHKRMLGDLTIPNDGAGTNPRFTTQSSISAGWFPPGLTYPTNTGSINPAVSNLDLAGANAVEASRGTTAPPLSAAGLGYTMESWEGMLATSLMWLHAGYADALGWGNNAVRRNAANFDRYGGWTDNASTQAARSFLAHLCNYLYATSYNEVAVTGGQGGRRLLPDVSPWLVLGTWSKTASTPGGPTTPTVVNPTVTAATATLAAQARTVDAQATVTAGSAAVTSVRFAWGDGTPDTVDTAAPFAALHTYATSGAKRVTMTATAADGGTATVARDVTVPVAGDTSPVVAFAATTATRGRSPHTVTFSLAGTVSGNGTALTASVAWGDGTTLASAPLTGTFSHTYTGTTFPAAFVAVATVTQASTSQVVQRSVAVTVDAPLAQAEYFSLGGWKTADGELLQVRVTADTGGLDVVTSAELAAALAGYATSGAVASATADAVKLTGNQTVAGTKTFTAAPVVPVGAFGQDRITGLPARLAALESGQTSGGGPDLPEPQTPMPVLAGPLRTVNVSTRAQFLAATAPGTLRDGDRIVLAGTAAAPINYGLSGTDTVITTPATTGFTPDSPPLGIHIVAANRRGALFDRGSTASGYSMFFQAANYVQLEGVVVRGGEKSFMGHRSNFNRLVDCDFGLCGMEIVHFRIFSSDNQIIDCDIHDAGVGATLADAGKSEAVYFGQATSTWATVYAGDSAGGVPDKSDRNQLLNSRLSNFRAEGVDIKEGTTGGVIRGNTMNGAQISGENDADSFVDCKGNDYLIEDNVLVSPSTAVIHAMETHINYAGFGDRNVFKGNTLVAGGKTGVVSNSTTGSMGINILKSGSRGAAANNVVYDDNTVTGAPGGLTNIPVTAASSATAGGGGDPSTYVTDAELAAALQGKANQATIDAAVSTPTPSTLMRRDTAGRVSAADPAADGDLVTRRFATALGAATPTPSTIARRDPVGRLQAIDPAAGPDVATMAWTQGIVAAVNNRVTDLSSTGVTTTTAQTINGVKTFVDPPVVPANSFPVSAVGGLTAAVQAAVAAAVPPNLPQSFQRLAADYSLTATTINYQNVFEQDIVNVGEVWVIHLVGGYTSSAAGDLKARVAASAGVTFIAWGNWNGVPLAGAAATDRFARTTPAAQFSTPQTFEGGTLVPVKLEQYAVEIAAVPATGIRRLIVQFAQNTADAVGPTLIAQGTSCAFTRVA